MDRYTRNVLVVEPYPVERERLTAALEGDGFEVELCSGPTAPDYTCIGAGIGRCPLATATASSCWTWIWTARLPTWERQPRSSSPSISGPSTGSLR
jgi:hypothetical protein